MFRIKKRLHIKENHKFCCLSKLILKKPKVSFQENYLNIWFPKDQLLLLVQKDSDFAEIITKTNTGVFFDYSEKENLKSTNFGIIIINS